MLGVWAGVLWTGVMGPSSLPVDVTRLPRRPRWALGLLGEGQLQREGGCCLSQIQIQLPAAWQSGDRGCLKTLGSRCLNPSGAGDYDKWPGGQGALLDALGWAVFGE